MEGALDFTSPSSLLLSTINRESRRAIAPSCVRSSHIPGLPLFAHSYSLDYLVGKVVANDGNERRVSDR